MRLTVAELPGRLKTFSCFGGNLYRTEHLAADITCRPFVVNNITNDGPRFGFDMHHNAPGIGWFPAQELVFNNEGTLETIGRDRHIAISMSTTDHWTTNPDDFDFPAAVSNTFALARKGLASSGERTDFGGGISLLFDRNLDNPFAKESFEINHFALFAGKAMEEGRSPAYAIALILSNVPWPNLTRGEIDSAFQGQGQDTVENYTQSLHLLSLGTILNSGF